MKLQLAIIEIMKKIEYYYFLNFNFYKVYSPQKYTRMDLNFIQAQHRENVLKLMQICGVDMKEAYELYKQSGFNFEAAVNRKFNPPPVAPVAPAPPPVAYVPPQNNYMEALGYEDDDIEYAQYKQFRRSGKTFDKKFPVRSSQTFLKTILPRFLRNSEEDQVFKRNLQKFIGKSTPLKPVDGNLSQAFEWCYKQKFPLARQSRYDVKVLFSDDQLIQKVLSQQFYPYGLNAKQYVVEDELKNFFNMQRDVNSIIICRVTLTDQIQVISRIKLAEGLEEIKKKLKIAKSTSIQSQMDQSYIIKQYNQERRGNFNYERPRTIKESIKMREDRKLKKQQDEQFFKACQPKQAEKKQETKPQVKKQIQPKQQFQRKKQIEPQNTAPTIPYPSIEQITKKRQEKLLKFPKYSDGFRFKVRVPSGQNIIIVVSPQEKVQYLFDYISLQPEDLGFNDEIGRKFDIFMGFGGSQTIKGKEMPKIKDVLQDSEVLIVRQIVE